MLYYHFDKKLALVPYGRLLTLKPQDPGYLTLRANIYLDLGLHDLALRDYKRAYEFTEGREGWIAANCGNLLTNVGLFREGIGYLEEALKVEPDSQYSHERLAAAMKHRDDQEKKLTEILKEARH